MKTTLNKIKIFKGNMTKDMQDQFTNYKFHKLQNRDKRKKV